jgi:hypothetical protein
LESIRRRFDPGRPLYFEFQIPEADSKPWNLEFSFGIYSSPRSPALLRIPDSRGRFHALESGIFFWNPFVAGSTPGALDFEFQIPEADSKPWSSENGLTAATL